MEPKKPWVHEIIVLGLFSPLLGFPMGSLPGIPVASAASPYALDFGGMELIRLIGCQDFER